MLILNRPAQNPGSVTNFLMSKSMNWRNNLRNIQRLLMNFCSSLLISIIQLRKRLFLAGLRIVRLGTSTRTNCRK
uniref:Uncharacterized protein n=2 Tax=Meloidogyne TaxID=189290 RepID=A0A6V7WVL9_MELEN|nr:unnamed protein product [Meloidogyne enterolobii]